MMRGDEVEEFYDACGINRLLTAMAGPRRTLAIAEVDNSKRDLAGSQAARAELLDRCRGDIRGELFKPGRLRERRRGCGRCRLRPDDCLIAEKYSGRQTDADEAKTQGSRRNHQSTSEHSRVL